METLTKKTTIFWFRQDLRITDNPGLFAASSNGGVLPIYILDDKDNPFKMGEASRWWLHNSLIELNKCLRFSMNVYTGKSQEILIDLVKRHNVSAVYWNRCYEPWRIKNDTDIKTALKELGVECKSFNGSLLWEPWEVLKKDGTPYKVFTSFYNNGCQQANKPRQPLPKIQNVNFMKDQHNQTTIEDLNLLPNIPWHKTMEKSWKIGEEAAHSKLLEFLNVRLSGYKENRVSKLSPHLHFGEISPNQIWHSVKSFGFSHGLISDLEHFLSEIAWREFSHYLLYHFPDLAYKNFQTKFDKFPWQKNQDYLKAWQMGKTGYPIIDAGMRELWQTGYMHNRVRMIVGSFLVKNLLLHWHHGRDWFWNCLVDADLANNSSSWQWIAGSGADAAPYFRIFNPVTQGEKFDPEGTYTRKFVPELDKMPNEYLFKPWQAPERILKKCKIIIGEDYPNPIVNLEESRKAALSAYKSL
jgi:deoxyribodipyrimidine photo-lyase